MDNFSSLEEKNLQLIRQCQDVDEQLERKRDQKAKLSAEFAREFKELESKVTEIEGKISRSQKDNDVLGRKKQDSNRQMISEKTYGELRKKVCKIAGDLATASTKLADKSTIENLLEIERQIDKFITYQQIILKAEKREKNIDDRKIDGDGDAQMKQRIKDLPMKQLVKTVRTDYKKER